MNFNKLSEMLVKTSATYVFYQLFLTYIPFFITIVIYSISSITTTTRRFFLRFSLEVFGTVGWSSPFEDGVILLRSFPACSKAKTRALARFKPKR